MISVLLCCRCSKVRPSATTTVCPQSVCCSGFSLRDPNAVLPAAAPCATSPGLKFSPVLCCGYCAIAWVPSMHLGTCVRYRHAYFAVQPLAEGEPMVNLDEQRRERLATAVEGCQNVLPLQLFRDKTFVGARHDTTLFKKSLKIGVQRNQSCWHARAGHARAGHAKAEHVRAGHAIHGRGHVRTARGYHLRYRDSSSSLS